MFKKTRDFNAAECMIWIYKFNPGKVNIYLDEDFPIYLIISTPISELIFPEGWHYSESTNTINNDNNSIIIKIEKD